MMSEKNSAVNRRLRNKAKEQLTSTEHGVNGYSSKNAVFSTTKQTKKKLETQLVDQQTDFNLTEDYHIQHRLSTLRDTVDGDARSDTSTPEFQAINHANRSALHKSTNAKRSPEVAGGPFVVSIHFDIAAVILFVLAVITRFWRLEQPRSIVFDELHYGKYLSLYMKRTFFFDSQPPLGKQLTALAAYLGSYNESFVFGKIGAVYPADIPVWSLRCLPALFGSFLVPTCYHVMRQSGLSFMGAFIGSLMVLFDNALLTQSRFLLMDTFMLQFSAFSIYSLLKFKRLHNSPFTFQWWFWLVVLFASCTCALCVKYIAVVTWILIFAILLKDYWIYICDVKFDKYFLAKYAAALFTTGICFSIGCYLLVFYVHLSYLTKAGPHDNVMTSAFQASLEGGLASITKGQPLQIVHGSQITLRHTHGRLCWLHSHSHVYPIRYTDGRGSSHQQQVTCYSFKDINNWWIVKRPHKNNLVVIKEELDPIRHGDLIQLVHGITSRALNSHDVASAMTPQCQEVTCYIDYNISMPAQNIWKVEILNRESEGDTWHTIQSQVRLIHVNTSQALRFSGRQLPEWGFNQHEVVTDRQVKQEDTVWNVEEHRYTKKSDKKERDRELGMAEFMPLAPTRLSFWEKFLELQIKMMLVDQENVQEHMYSSDPLEWPFMTRGIAYWVSPTSNAQVHLIGNVVIWYTASFGVLTYVTILLFYLLRRRRACYDIPFDVWVRFLGAGELFLTAFVLHYLPFFITDKTLFLHHYLPAFVYKVILTAAVIDHVWNIIKLKTVRTVWRFAFVAALSIWIFMVVLVYFLFLVFSYGHYPLTASEIISLRWKETWDFIVHKQ